MKNRRILLSVIVLLIVFSVPFASRGWAQDDPYQVEVSWTEPTWGSMPVMYHLYGRSKVDGADEFDEWKLLESTPDLKVTLTYKRGYCYEAKVQAEDKDGLIGPFSIPSLEYCGISIDQDNAPGQPGTPTLVK